jgi:hypothetical protein
MKDVIDMPNELPIEQLAIANESQHPFDPDATLEVVRRQLDDMVAWRATGQWTTSDEAHYARLAEHEAMLLRRCSA